MYIKNCFAIKTARFRGYKVIFRLSPCRAGFWSGRGIPVVLILLFLFALGSGENSLRAQQRQKFLIIEKPSNLEFFDKYEQKLSFRERRNFAAYQPFLIQQANAYLSDNFTPVMEVVGNGRRYFILLDQSGKLFQKDRAGYVRIFSNCMVLNDTVEVLVNRTLFLAKRPTFRTTRQSQKYFLSPGDRLRRIFRRGEFAYVEKTGSEKEFGWCFLARSREGRFWRVLTPKPHPSAELSENTQSKIREEVEQLNQLSGMIFTRLNSARGASKPTPRWSFNKAKEEWRIELSPEAYNLYFKDTRRSLLRKLDNLLLGSSYQAELSPDGILISRRRQ